MKTFNENIMNCNCFNEVNKRLREKLGDPEGSLNCMLQFTPKELKIRPSITFVYRKKKKDGTFNLKKDEIEVAYSYCPFCGKPYKP